MTYKFDFIPHHYFTCSDVLRRHACLQLVLANPGAEVMKKLNKSKLIEKIGQEWMYLTVGEAVGACNFMLHTGKPDPLREESEAYNKV